MLSLNIVNAAPLLDLIKAGSGNHTANYTMLSRQIENYMEVNISSNETLSQCFLEWNSGTKTNYSMTVGGTGANSYCFYNMTNQPSGIDYTFLVFANDTSNNWANYTWYKRDYVTGGWNQTKYVQLNNTVISLDYQKSYYFYAAAPYFTLSYPYASGVLNHEQGTDGTQTDTGYWWSYRDSNADQTIYCVAFVGMWFDDNVTIANTTVNNSYVHIWFTYDNSTGQQASFGIGKQYTNDYVQFPRNITRWFNQTITSQDVGGTVYYLVSELIEFSATPLWFDENDIYDYAFKMRGGAGGNDPEVRNHKNASSFILINIPDNTTLEGLDSDSDGMNDFVELYGNFTDPFYSDTDNDGVTDNCDVAPNDPAIITDVCNVTIPQIWYNETDSLWRVNCTLPSASTGLYNLYVQGNETGTYNIIRDDTQTNALNYGVNVIYESLLDFASWSDNILKTSSFYRSLTTSFTYTDLSSKISSFFKSLTIGSTYSDILSKLSLFFKSVTQSGTYADLISKLSNYFKSLTTSSSYSESNSFFRKVEQLLTTSSLYSDSTARLTSFYKTVTSSGTYSDLSVRINSFYKSITDTNTYTDKLGFTRVFYKSVTQSGIYSDLSSRLGTFYKSVTQSGAYSDITSKLSSFYKSVTQSGTYSGLLSRYSTLFVSSISSISSSDALSKFYIKINSLTDYSTYNDLITRVYEGMIIITSFTFYSDLISKTTTAITTYTQILIDSLTYYESIVKDIITAVVAGGGGGGGGLPKLPLNVTNVTNVTTTKPEVVVIENSTIILVALFGLSIFILSLKKKQVKKLFKIKV